MSGCPDTHPHAARFETHTPQANVLLKKWCYGQFFNPPAQFGAELSWAAVKFPDRWGGWASRGVARCCCRHSKPHEQLV